MPRKKAKINYFPLDVDMVYDIKVRKLMKRKGHSGAFVYITLLQHIYKNGYYLHLGEDELFYIADAVYGEEQEIKEIIETCVDLNLFDKEIYEEHSILTSAAVQSRYTEMRRRMKSLPEIQEYNLLDTKIEDADKEENNDSAVNETPEIPTSDTTDTTSTPTFQRDSSELSTSTPPQSSTPSPTGNGNPSFKKNKIPQMGEEYIEGIQMMLKRLGHEPTVEEIQRHYEEFIARERVMMSTNDPINERDWFIHFRNYIIIQYKNSKTYDSNKQQSESDRYKARRGVDKAYHTTEEYEAPFL